MKRFALVFFAFVMLLSFSSCGMYNQQEVDEIRLAAYDEGYDDGLSAGEFTWRDFGYDEGFSDGYDSGYADGTKKGSDYVYDELSPSSIEDSLNTILAYSEGDASWSEMHEAVSKIFRCLEYAKNARNYYR